MVFGIQIVALVHNLFLSLPCDCEVRGQCMCNEMPVIPVDRAMDKKRIIGINGGLRRRRGTRGR
jgi:hypothetical protein